MSRGRSSTARESARGRIGDQPRDRRPSVWPQAGRIEFIRFIRSDRKLRLLRRSITVPEEVVYRYVTATLDLSIAPADGNLLVHREGELALRASIALPIG